MADFPLTDTILKNDAGTSDSKTLLPLDVLEYSKLGGDDRVSDSSDSDDAWLEEATYSLQNDKFRKRERFRIKQKWEGNVIEVSDDSFYANLETLYGEETEIEAEIYLEEVDPLERPLVKAGAIFYWSIGYLDRPSGTIRISKIRFRRMPSWTPQELESANAEAVSLRKLFDDT